MSIQINLTPDDIDALVKDSIMKAGFGAAITKAVTTTLSGYNSPIDAAIRSYVAMVASELIKTHFDGPIREAVHRSIDEKITAEMVATVSDRSVAKMIDAAERY